MPADGNVRLGLGSRDPCAADAVIARVRETITGQARDWTALLQELIRIPSCFEAEHAIVRRVCDHVAATGLTPTLVPMNAAALRAHSDAVGPISEVPGR